MPNPLLFHSNESRLVRSESHTFSIVTDAAARLKINGVRICLRHSYCRGSSGNIFVRSTCRQGIVGDDRMSSSVQVRIRS